MSVLGDTPNTNLECPGMSDSGKLLPPVLDTLHWPLQFPSPTFTLPCAQEPDLYRRYLLGSLAFWLLFDLANGHRQEPRGWEETEVSAPYPTGPFPSSPSCFHRSLSVI